MRSVHGVALWLSWGLAACVTQCDEGTPRVVGRVADPAALPSSRTAPAAKPTAELQEPTAKPEKLANKGPVLNAEAFEPFVPDELSGYAASAPPERVTMGVPGNHDVTALKRRYRKDGVTLDVELIDALYTPTPIQLVKQSQSTQRKMHDVHFDGQSIAGYPGLLQWNEADKSAKASVVLEDRYLVNVQVSPAADTEEALRLVAGLPLDRIAALEASPSNAPAAK